MSDRKISITVRNGDARYHYSTCKRLERTDPANIVAAGEDGYEAAMASAIRATCCKPSLAAWQAHQAAPPAAPRTRRQRADAKMTKARRASGKKAASTVTAAATEGPAGGTVQVARTFEVAAHPDGYTCRDCGHHLPPNKFPTITGPEHRSTRCRACRDAS